MSGLLYRLIISGVKNKDRTAYHQIISPKISPAALRDCDSLQLWLSFVNEVWKAGECVAYKRVISLNFEEMSTEVIQYVDMLLVESREGLFWTARNMENSNSRRVRVPITRYTWLRNRDASIEKSWSKDDMEERTRERIEQ